MMMIEVLKLCWVMRLLQMVEGAHPHMNNLVYGRRSAPSTVVHPRFFSRLELRYQRHLFIY